MTRLVCLCLLSYFLGLLIPSYFLSCFLHGYHYLCLTLMQPLLQPATTIIAHLTTQQVSHEIIDLELIVL